MKVQLSEFDIIVKCLENQMLNEPQAAYRSCVAAVCTFMEGCVKKEDYGECLDDFVTDAMSALNYSEECDDITKH